MSDGGFIYFEDLDNGGVQGLKPSMLENLDITKTEDDLDMDESLDPETSNTKDNGYSRYKKRFKQRDHLLIYKPNITKGELKLALGMNRAKITLTEFKIKVKNY